MGRSGAMLTPTNSFLLMGFFYLCSTFGENRLRNATVRVRTNRDTRTETNEIYNLCPMLYTIAMGQINIRKCKAKERPELYHTVC